MGRGRAGAGGCRRSAVRGRREGAAGTAGRGGGGHRSGCTGPGGLWQTVPEGGARRAVGLPPGLPGGSRSPRTSRSGMEVGAG